ncbi:hypothetical protein M9Y10_036307 [Tritrichomonas musculus]|uniref:Signal sequence receptor subunit alpha n=1 Tax=Tritrichomonas musculus TaxID=1915356 RepID=A0ABR2GLI2_9EUKA
MFFYFILALVLSEEKDGIIGTLGEFLPFAPKSKIDGRGILIDYPENKIPLQRFIRFISSFAVTGEETYGLQNVFGYVTPEEGGSDYRVNVTSYGMSGRLSNEDQPSFLFQCELVSQLEPGHGNLELWGKLTNEQGVNLSILLFNESVEFYEEVNLHDQIASAVLYVFFVGVVGGILYFIFSKDKAKETKPVSKKKSVQDYAQIHSSDRSRSPSRSSSPGSKRKDSPSAGKTTAGKK